jgi:hypothetical protein
MRPRAAERAQESSRYQIADPGARPSPNGPRASAPAPPPPSADLWPSLSIASPTERTGADAATAALKPSRGKAAAVPPWICPATPLAAAAAGGGAWREDEGRPAASWRGAGPTREG